MVQGIRFTTRRYRFTSRAPAPEFGRVGDPMRAARSRSAGPSRTRPVLTSRLRDCPTPLRLQSALHTNLSQGPTIPQRTVSGGDERHWLNLLAVGVPTTK